MTFSEFLESIEPMQAEAIAYLDSYCRQECGMTRKMRYKVPFYDSSKWICYLNPIKKTHIELCFLNGRPMADHFPSLDMKGRKLVSGLTIDTHSDLPLEAITMIKSAIRLNDTIS